MWFLYIALLCAGAFAATPDLPREIRFQTGASNTVLIGDQIAIYGVPPGKKVAQLLLTHARRDILLPVPPTAKTVVPAAERELFENPVKFWADLETGRFHDYAQQGTKVPIETIPVARAVSDGDVIEEGKTRIRVLTTPGYTRGAVSYLIETGGKRVACTGDLIYGDGQLFDLYSLQDAVPEAKARGYHGYAARAEALIASLRRIASEKPDVLLPARGPAIKSPQSAINKLIGHLESFLTSHFETDALRWYWGEENHRIRSRAAGTELDVMPMSEQESLPKDIVAIGNSRVILSRSGAAFLVDAGYRNLLPELMKLKDAKKITGVDGIWITHYHDDHTDYINDVMNAFGAPVYFTSGMAEVMEKPGWFRLPCLTNRAVTFPGARPDGQTLRWQEWEFTFLHFPGQTLYHGGLLAKRDDGQNYLFVGDSFTPTGMDDYCMQNRNTLREGEGYEYCLRKIGGLPSTTWLINQHVLPMFRYSGDQLSRMRRELSRRSGVLSKLSPWPDINYMTDESWARLHPYGAEAAFGQALDLELRIMNHAPDRMTYRIQWNLPKGWTLVNGSREIVIEPRREGVAKAQVTPTTTGLHILTADIAFGGRELRHWTEALVRVR